MKTIILIIGLGIALSSKAQVNVYSCAVSNHQLTQQELEQHNDFFSTCYTLGGNAPVLISNTATKTIRASESIHLKKGVHLGGFTGSGKTHLYLDKDSSDFAVVVMNYTTLKNVWKYKKLELGITPPQAMQERINHFLFQEGQFTDQLNPFLSWDVDVEAHFTHLNSGEEITVPGFFTREYKEDSATSDWLDIGTDYPFRIRFAPPKTGQWNCTITIALNKQATYQSLPFSFNVNDVGAHGYVKVASNHKNLMLDNRMIFPIGQNFPTDANGSIPGDECFDADSVHVYPCSWDSGANKWVKDMTKPPIYYGHKLLTKNNTEKTVNTVYWKKFLLEISAYLNTSDPGGRKYLRIIQTPAASMIEFEDKGNYYKRLHYAWEMDKLMDTCEKYDALMDFDMMMQYPIMKYTNFGNWIFDWGHYMVNYSLPQGHQVVYDSTDTWGVYCYNDNPGIKEPYEMFLNAQDIAYHKQRVRYLLARWGYSTQIYEWELLSEPFHLNEIGSSLEPEPYLVESAPFHQETRQAVYNYEQKISGYIKDSLTCIKQLVGIDMEYNDDAFDVATVGLPTIDIVGFNSYYKYPADVYSINAYVKKIWAKSYHKKIPVLIPEGGTDNYYDECANYAMHPVDLMSVPFSGVAGFNTWEGYKPISSYNPTTEKLTMPTYIQKMWQQVVRAKNHFNGDDVINTLKQGGGAWTHGMQVHAKIDGNGVIKKYKDKIETQYYISYDRNLVVGYVKNLTYNLYTKTPNKSCLPDDLINDMETDNYEQVRYLDWPEWNSSGIKRYDIYYVDKKEKYCTDFYSFITDDFGMGSYVNGASYCKKSSFFTFKPPWDDELSKKHRVRLEFPSLTTWSSNTGPVLWFVMKKQTSNAIDTDRKDLYRALDDKQLGVTDEKLTHEILYPNPSYGKYTIESPYKQKIIVKDLKGKLIYTALLQKGRNSVDLSSKQPGVYLIFFLKSARVKKIVRL